MRLFRSLAWLLPFALCAAAPSAARPALWKVADADTTIWLFGTIHVLPKDYAWRGPAFDAAVKAADRLVIEVVMDRDPATAAALLAGLARSDGLKPLVERVAADKRAALEALIRRSGVPQVRLDGLETWAAALTLMGVTLRDLKLSTADGVEQTLETEFKAADKPIEGLETAAEQLGYFDTLPEADQVTFLESLLDPPAESKAELDAMMAAWSSGSEAAISASFDEEMKASPALREVLLDRRNAAWADAVAKRMEQPGETLIAVGAGHLAGGGSVQKRLAERGFKVERVQ